MKQKKCKICKNKFIPERQLQQVCSYLCSVEYGKAHLSKKAKEKKTQAYREKKKFNESDKIVLKKLAQMLFNKWIRIRDKDLNCISCDYDFKKYTSKQPRQAHASHYRPATNSKLRYDERNVHKSCQICNTHLSGNLANYRIALIEKIGLKEVKSLEAENGIYRYTVEELNEIITKYREKIKGIA